MFKPNQLNTWQKRGVVLATLSIIVAVGVGSAIILHNDSTLSVEYEVESWDDPTDVHRVTQMEVRVTNTGDEPIEPVFNTLHGDIHTRNYWNIRTGPETLEGGETAVYTVRAQIPQYGLPFGTETVLSINDKGTQVQKKIVLDPVYDKSAPEILNSAIRHWQINPGEDHFRPYRWGISTSDHGDEKLSIDEQDESANLRVEYATRDSGPWAMAGIHQRSDFPEELYVNATPQTLIDSPSQHPSHASGVELAEGNHRVWIVFADIDERELVYRSGEIEYALIFVPAEEGETVETTVDIDEIYSEFNWRKPDSETRTIDGNEYEYQPVNVLAFAAAYPQYQNQSVEVTIHEIRGVE